MEGKEEVHEPKTCSYNSKTRLNVFCNPTTVYDALALNIDQG